MDPGREIDMKKTRSAPIFDDSDAPICFIRKNFFHGTGIFIVSISAIPFASARRNVVLREDDWTNCRTPSIRSSSEVSEELTAL